MISDCRDFNTHTSMKRTSFLSILLAATAVAAGTPTPLPENGVVLEQWHNVKSGKMLDLLPIFEKRPADAIYIKGAIDEYATGMDHYCARFTCMLTVPTTGEYTFYLSADDSAELLLSPNDSTDKLHVICSVNSFKPRHHYTGVSTKIKLEQGKKYALSVLYREAINDEHVSVAWEGPGIKKSLIPTHCLHPVLTADQHKIWQHTTTTEARGNALLEELCKQPKQQLATWLNKLHKDDLVVLDAALKKAQSLLAAGSPAAYSQGMQHYAKLAEGIVATPESPVSNPVAKTLLHMEDAWLKTLSEKQLLKLGAHRLAGSLGEIPASAKPVKVTQKLNSHADKWREEYVSLGTYALPGKPVSITIPQEYVGKNLEVQVGHHFPHQNRPLVCMPNTTQWFKLDKATTTIITPHGGLMLLKVPREIPMAATPVTIDGAIQAPRFILGQHTDKDWQALKNAPAPWGELVSEHIILLAPRDVLQAVTNPTEVMTWWNTNNRDLEDFYAYYPKVAFRMHSGHYAEEGISFWPLQWERKNMAYLLNLPAMQANNSALFLHEHGHHSDFWEMELSFWAESTTNWGGYYMKAREGKAFNWKDSHDQHLRRLFDKNDPSMQEIMQDQWYKISTKGTHHWSYPITSMMIGYAETFGWECVKTTIKRLRDINGDMYTWPFVINADVDQAKIDRYLIGLSESAQRDVRPYFAHFKLFASEGAAAYLNNKKLPKWDLTYLAQPKELRTAKNTPFSIACGSAELLSFAEKSRIEWVPSTQMGGNVSMQDNGHAIYTPKPGFSGVDVLKYTLYNHYGQSAVKEMHITVE